MKKKCKKHVWKWQTIWTSFYKRGKFIPMGYRYCLKCDRGWGKPKPLPGGKNGYDLVEKLDSE